MSLLESIKLEDIINDSNKKIENLSKVIIRWAKERHLLDKIGFEKYREEYRKNNLIFWVSDISLYREGVSKAYNKLYGKEISVTFNELNNIVNYTNDEIGRTLFIVKSNTFGVPSIRLK